MSYIAAVAALTGNMSAYDVPLEDHERFDSSRRFRGERVVLVGEDEAPIETAYSAKMRNYYDSIYQRSKPAQVIIIER
jgi:hypothetical protein